MHVSIISITTLDGRIAPAGFGSQEDRSFLEQMRAETDASLLGAGSLRESDPEMRGPNGLLDPSRLRCLVTSSSSLPRTRKIFSDPAHRPLVFCPRQRVSALRKSIGGETAEIIGMVVDSRGMVPLEAILKELAGRGVERLLIEGGGRLNHEALMAGIVDELLLTLAPKISGRVDTPCLADGPEHLGSPMLELALKEWRVAPTGELFLRYRILRKKQS
ncbi:RibD family protein [Desulfolithobacter sp.]